MTIEALGEAGFFDKIDFTSADVDGDGKKEDVGIENVLKCAAMGKAVGKTTCLAITAIGMMTIKTMADVKREPVGVNSLGLYYPWVFFSKGKVEEYPLVDDVLPYYVELYKGAESTNFYLASPCKADLNVEFKLKECALPRCKKYYEMLERPECEWMGEDLPSHEEMEECSKTLTEKYGCKAADGSCVLDKLGSDVQAAGAKGICWCIDEEENPCRG